MSFNRLIELTVGETLISDLRIHFEVNKSITSSTNEAKIEIYNLSEVTRKKIIDANQNVVLRAGYEDEGGLENLFFGTTTKPTTRRNGQDIIVVLEAFDGVTEIREKTFNTSYKEGTGINQVINDITAVLGLPVKGQDRVTSSRQYVNGFAYSGLASDALTKVLAFDGKIYSIQNNEIYILSPDEPLVTTAININPNSGLINSPEEYTDTSTEQSNDPVQRYKFKCLLYPSLIPGGVVRLESKIVTGNFKIDSVKSTGDNYANEFISEVEVRAI